MEFETVIGLEVHCELATRTKIFCSCLNEFGGEPNTHCCPVCLGMPGALPVMNRAAVEMAVKAGLALNCQIAKFSKFDRKNYFYPDLPKSYQTSQYEYPICLKGHVDLDVNGEPRRIGITRIHLEEDAGKLVHGEYGGTMLDLNRGGVPLIEIVTEPDLRSAEEARVFLEKLKADLSYIEVSDCKMEQGSLRCDVNVSVRPVGQKEFGTRCELKNINSFKAVVRAIEYERDRQIDLIEDGEEIKQETRRWDDVKGVSLVMRSKEDAMDYRYFPCPDLVPIVLSDEDIERAKREMPELPDVKKARYVRELALPEYDAGVITGDKSLAAFFDRCVALFPNAKMISNWIMGDVLKKAKEYENGFDDMKLDAGAFTDMLKALDAGKISAGGAKTVLDELLTGTGKSVGQIIEEKKLAQISDTGAILKIVTEVLDANPQSVAELKAGKDKVMAFLMGQVMRASKGKANPQTVNELIRAEIKNR
ncbi:MAG: Asp-tRNA(Asn)/Glu-tRNA(Gln) amidotransferase subunit GatB [Eubacteriales bacterium]|nr:Asp-tRNA(Asn)/Glu-tRNA(Gln) amidotransferase subunit GatB [Eubacteriales bacterium]